MTMMAIAICEGSEVKCVYLSLTAFASLTVESQFGNTYQVQEWPHLDRNSLEPVPNMSLSGTAGKSEHRRSIVYRARHALLAKFRKDAIDAQKNHNQNAVPLGSRSTTVVSITRRVRFKSGAMLETKGERNKRLKDESGKLCDDAGELRHPHNIRFSKKINQNLSG